MNVLRRLRLRYRSDREGQYVCRLSDFSHD